MRPSESFLGQPVRDLQTMLRVIANNDSRIPSVIPDGIYGPDTMQAVTAFQRNQGLPVTGITDQQTWDAIVEEYTLAIVNVGKAQPIEVLIKPNQVFRMGDSNPYIFLLQGILFQLSKDHTSIPLPTISGIIDQETSDSVAAFQKLAGLPVTGSVDRLTWKHLALQFTANAHHNGAN